jgi:hypothetical protein
VILLLSTLLNMQLNKFLSFNTAIFAGSLPKHCLAAGFSLGPSSNREDERYIHERGKKI